MKNQAYFNYYKKNLPDCLQELVLPIPTYTDKSFDAARLKFPNIKSKKMPVGGSKWQNKSPDDLINTYEWISKSNKDMNSGTRCDNLFIIDIDSDKSIKDFEKRTTKSYDDLIKVLEAMFPLTEINLENFLIEQTTSGGLHCYFKIEYTDLEQKEINAYFYKYDEYSERIYIAKNNCDQKREQELTKERDQLENPLLRFKKQNRLVISYEYLFDENSNIVVKIDKAGKKKYAFKNISTFDLLLGAGCFVITAPSQYDDKKYSFTFIPNLIPTIESKNIEDLINTAINNFQPIAELESVKDNASFKTINDEGGEMPTIYRIFIEKGIEIGTERDQYWECKCPFHNSDSNRLSGLINKDGTFHCFHCNIHLDALQVCEKLNMPIPTEILKMQSYSPLEDTLRYLGMQGLEHKESKKLYFKCICDSHKDTEKKMYVLGEKIYCEECGSFQSIIEYMTFATKNIFRIPEDGTAYMDLPIGTFCISNKSVKGSSGERVLKISPFLLKRIGNYSNPVTKNLIEDQEYFIQYSKPGGGLVTKTAKFDTINNAFTDNTTIHESITLNEKYLRFKLNTKWETVYFFNRPGFYYEPEKEIIKFSNGNKDVEVKPSLEDISDAKYMIKTLVDFAKNAKSPAKSYSIWCVIWAAHFGLVAKQNNSLSRFAVLTGKAQTGKTTSAKIFNLPFYRNTIVKNLQVLPLYGAETAKNAARLFRLSDDTSMAIVADESDTINNPYLYNTLKTIAGNEICGRRMAIEGEGGINNVYATWIYTSNIEVKTLDPGILRRADIMAFDIVDVCKVNNAFINEISKNIDKYSNGFMNCFIDFCEKHSKQIVENIVDIDTLYGRGEKIINLFCKYLNLDFKIKADKDYFYSEKEQQVSQATSIIDIISRDIIKSLRDSIARNKQVDGFGIRYHINYMPAYLRLIAKKRIIITKDITEIIPAFRQLSYLDIKQFLMDDNAMWEEHTAKINGKIGRFISVSIDDFDNHFMSEFNDNPQAQEILSKENNKLEHIPF